MFWATALCYNNSMNPVRNRRAMQRQRVEALKTIFSLAVRFLKRGDFDIAHRAFEIVVRESEGKEKKGFFAKILWPFSLRAKAEKYLKEIPLRQARAEKKKEAETPPRVQAEAERQRKEEERRKKEGEKREREKEKKTAEEKIKMSKKEKRYLRRQELQMLFQKTLDCHRKKETEVASGLAKRLFKELAEEKKRVGFFDKIRFINPLIKKTQGILSEIQQKKREEEIRRRHMEKLKEVEEIIRKQKEKIEELKEAEKPKEAEGPEETGKLVEIKRVERPEEAEKEEKVIIKKYEQPLEVKEKELATKYEEQLAKKEEELAEKMRESKTEEEAKKKEEEALVEARKLEKIRQELEKELEEREEKTRKKYEEELAKVKKALEEKKGKEVKVWEEKITGEELQKRREALKKEEEELKSREVEIRKMREAPPEPLPKEVEKKREEAILMAEEELRERRRLIEEETRRIEETEKKREKPEEEIGEKEESELEKEQRRARLKEAIKKEKERAAPKEAEKEEKEKAANLNVLFEEAIFHYKEKDLDRAIEIFREIKRLLPEPEKEPGFFARIFGKVPLYIKIEDYISRIEKEKAAGEKGQIKIIRERAKIAAGKKRKVRYPFLPGIKRIANKLILANPIVILKRFLFLPPLVAIDISDYSIEILRLSKQQGILTYGRSVIKKGVVQEGEIKDQKELSLAFKSAANQARFKPFRPKQGPILRGIVSVPEYQVNVQVFSFKSRENIFEKVKEEIKKTVPFPVDELYWDYLETWDEKLNKTKVLAVAVLRDIIDEQIYFLKSSGVEPVVFDIGAVSIGRALLTEKESTLILDIGAGVTNINIFDESGFINLSTAIPYAEHYLRDKVSEYFSVSQEEAETIINLKGFRREDNVIWKVLEKEMEKIVKEIKEAIRYYQKETGKGIKKIILAGGTALLPEIGRFFQSCFPEVEVEIGDPLKKIKRRAGLDPQKAVLYANSIGLALRSIMKDPLAEGINLLPGKIKEKEKKVYWQRHRQKLIIIKIILAVLILAAALLVYFYLF